jgi:hypothetical protein
LFAAGEYEREDDMRRLIACLLLAFCWTSAAHAQKPVATPSAPVETPAPATPSGPQDVVIGAYVNDIQSVTLAQHAYAVDLYVWFRWKDPNYDPTKSVEFMNLSNAWDHQDSWAFEKPEEQPDGSFYNVLHHQSMFSNKFPLGAYPFDKQTLVVALEDTVNADDAVHFKLDDKPVSMNPEVKLPGYELQPVQIVLRDKPYPTTFGELTIAKPQAYSHVEIRIPVVRPLSSGLFKVLAPILLIILTATLALLLSPEYIEARVGLAITALLTLVALQFTLLSGLPEVAYLTLLDQIFLGSYGYILLVIAVVVGGSRTAEGAGLTGLARMANGWGGAAVIVLLYSAGIGALIYLNTLAPQEAPPKASASYAEPG